MPRLRNTRTGSVVNVSDATAARLGGEWGPVEAEEKPASKKSTRRRSKAESTTTSDDD